MAIQDAQSKAQGCRDATKIQSCEISTELPRLYPMIGILKNKRSCRIEELLMRKTVQEDFTNLVNFGASLENIPKDSTITPNNLDDFTNDDYSKVKGLEKRGYIRVIGRMPAA
ncbi:hypothetical protein M8C21_015044, partial [Ambrosia artemisiifolia]